MDMRKHNLTDIQVIQFAFTSYTAGMTKANTTILTAAWCLTSFVNSDIKWQFLRFVKTLFQHVKKNKSIVIQHLAVFLTLAC
jgi:hypothetical protein